MKKTSSSDKHTGIRTDQQTCSVEIVEGVVPTPSLGVTQSKKFGAVVKRDPITAARVCKVAIIKQVTPRAVQRVIQGTRKNDDILETFMELSEAEDEIFESLVERETQKISA